MIIKTKPKIFVAMSLENGFIISILAIVLDNSSY